MDGTVFNRLNQAIEPPMWNTLTPPFTYQSPLNRGPLFFSYRRPPLFILVCDDGGLQTDSLSGQSESHLNQR